jgi:hypothetical protein
MHDLLGLNRLLLGFIPTRPGGCDEDELVKGQLNQQMHKANQQYCEVRVQSQMVVVVT